jgi:hypothetical protein
VILDYVKGEGRGLPMGLAGSRIGRKKMGLFSDRVSVSECECVCVFVFLVVPPPGHTH